MADAQLGMVLSVATALCWAVAVVLFKQSGVGLEPLALNGFKNVLGFALLLATGLVLGFGEQTASPREIALLCLSGALGIGLADTLLFEGLALIGAQRQAIVDAIYSPAVVLLSYLFWGEVLSPRAALGGALIMAAVVLASLPSASDLPISRPRLLRGLTYSSLAILLMALAIVIVKPILERNGVLWCTSVRLVGAIVTMGMFVLPKRARRQAVLAAFRPQPAWRFAIPGAFMGSYLGLLLWIGAFKYAPAGLAALLNQTSTVFIVLLAAAFLNEPLTPRIALSAGLALGGSVVVLL